MKLIIILLLVILILLPGCDAPVTVAERENQLQADYDALLVKQTTLIQENERLGNASANLTDLRNEHNKLINNYTTLQTQYAIMEAYYESLRNQYNQLVDQFSSKYSESGAFITGLHNENLKITARYKELDELIAAVNSGNVSILSDNLTDIEYNAFYKGWKLWWGSFNE